MTKKILFKNISFLILLMIFTIVLAGVFVPRPSIVGSGEDATWISEILELSDINLLANFSIIFGLATIYITNSWLMLDSDEKVNAIKKQLNSKKLDDKLIVISTILTWIQVLLFLILTAAVPFGIAYLREPIELGTGNNLEILSEPAINNTIYYLVLIPVFLSIVPLALNIGLSLYFEIMKRKKEKLESQKGN